MNCYHCEAELVWAGDTTFDEEEIDGEGIVTSLNCIGCGAFVEVYKEFTLEEYNKLFVCEFCKGDTSEVDYDYLVSTDHLECVLEDEQNKIDSEKEKVKDSEKEE